MTDQEYEKMIEEKFDSYCKAVIRNGARNEMRKAENRMKHQVMLEDMNEEEPFLAYVDEYLCTYKSFRVLNQTIVIHDEKLADALSVLPQVKRDVMLMAYILEMNDSEISKVLQIPRRTINEFRRSALESIKSLFAEE